ncbi:MAG: hypothetical protein GY732_03170, partial [Gammaproteobacteria bacterium]|nr:hypothetical protein [Gammaproteobacteria bacterium]
DAYLDQTAPAQGYASVTPPASGVDWDKVNPVTATVSPPGPIRDDTFGYLGPVQTDRIDSAQWGIPQSGIMGNVRGIVNDVLGPEYGVRATSGVRPNDTKHRHGPGTALDYDIMSPAGTPVQDKAARMAVGLTGMAQGLAVGIDPEGVGYMQDGIHMDQSAMMGAGATHDFWGVNETKRTMSPTEKAEFQKAKEMGLSYIASGQFADYMSKAFPGNTIPGASHARATELAGNMTPTQRPDSIPSPQPAPQVSTYQDIPDVRAPQPSPQVS